MKIKQDNIYKIIIRFLFLGMPFIVLNCSNNASNIENNEKQVDAPHWYLEKQSEDGYEFAASFSKNKDIAQAIRESKKIALKDLKKSIMSNYDELVSKISKDLQIQPQLLDSYLKEQDRVFSDSQVLDASVIAKQTFVEKNKRNEKIYTAYVLVRWDKKACNRRLLKLIKANNQIHNALKGHDSYEKLKKSVAYN